MSVFFILSKQSSNKCKIFNNKKLYVLTKSLIFVCVLSVVDCRVREVLLYVVINLLKSVLKLITFKICKLCRFCFVSKETNRFCPTLKTQPHNLALGQYIKSSSVTGIGLVT